MTRFLLISFILILPSTANAVTIGLGYSNSEAQIKCTPPNKEYNSRINFKVQQFANTYRPEVIKKYLSKIVFCNKLWLHGFAWPRGTYSLKGKMIFVEIDGHNDTAHMLHHEFSSILLFSTNKLNRSKWKSFNGDKYIHNWRLIHMGWKDDSKIQKNGFLYPYSQQDLENDFNVMAGLYLPNVPNYNDRLKKARRYPRINGKYLLLRDFYKGLLR